MYFRFKSRPLHHEEPLLNLTPLIDIVFVILIMFILVIPLLELDSIHLANGSGNSQNSTSLQTQSPIVVHVQRDNTIWIHNQRVDLSQLSAILNEERKRHAQAIPQLFHDRYAHFGTYQEVKNVMESVGFHKMEIVLQPGTS